VALLHRRWSNILQGTRPVLKAADTITTLSDRFHDWLDRIREADPELSNEEFAALLNNALDAVRTLSATRAETWQQHAEKLIVAGRVGGDLRSNAAEALIRSCISDAIFLSMIGGGLLPFAENPAE
jgi:hypothetical protein